jgi:hypothetical protein
VLADQSEKWSGRLMEMELDKELAHLLELLSAIESAHLLGSGLAQWLEALLDLMLGHRRLD